MIVVAAMSRRAEALEVTLCAYLHKPFDVDSLVRLVWQCPVKVPTADP